MSISDAPGALRITAAPQGSKITVIDAHLLPIASATESLEISVPPGVYRLRARLADGEEARFVTVAPGTLVTAHLDVPFKAVAPLTADARAAAVSGRANSLVIQASGVGPPFEPARHLRLIDRRGMPIGSLQEGWKTTGSNAATWSAGLPAGGYFLRLPEQQWWLEQSLWLHEGWQTLIFIEYDNGHAVASNVHLTPTGTPWRPSETANVLLEMVMAASRAGVEVPLRNPSDELLHANPMLGLATAHVWRLQPEVEHTVAALIRRLIPFLPDHPDVLAMIRGQSSGWPPMFASSYRRRLEPASDIELPSAPLAGGPWLRWLVSDMGSGVHRISTDGNGSVIRSDSAATMRQLLESSGQGGVPGDIEELRRRYAAAPPGGPAAARAAGALGRGLALRYMRDGGGEQDRDEAIDLLDEALGVPHEDATVTHVVLGTLLFFRVVPIRPGGSGDPAGAQAFAVFWALMTGQADTPARRADRDRVRAHMRWVSEHEPADAPVRAAAEAMVVALDLFSGSVPGPEALARLSGVAGSFGPSMGEMVNLLRTVTDDTPAHQLAPALDAVLRQLPAGHRLRSVILAEAGVLLAQGPPDDLPDALTGLLPALSETIEQLPAGDPLRDATIRKLAGLLVSAGARTSDPAEIARAVQLADDIVAQGGDGRDRFLRAMALTLRGRTAGDLADLRAAMADLTAALDALQPDDELQPAAAAMLGALLNDQYLLQGQRASANAGDALLTAAHAALDAARADSTVVALAGLMSRTILAVRHGGRAELDQVIDQLEEGLAIMDEHYPWRSRLDAGLGLAYLTRDAPGDLQRGAEHLRKADADLAVAVSGRPELRSVVALAGFLDVDPGNEWVLAQINEVMHGAASSEPD